MVDVTVSISAILPTAICRAASESFATNVHCCALSGMNATVPRLSQAVIPIPETGGVTEMSKIVDLASADGVVTMVTVPPPLSALISGIVTGARDNWSNVNQGIGLTICSWAGVGAWVLLSPPPPPLHPLMQSMYATSTTNRDRFIGTPPFFGVL